MEKNKRFLFYLGFFAITILFFILIGSAGYFRIGFLSFDYTDIFAAVNSSIIQKFESKLPFTNQYFVRPLSYITLQIDYFISDSLKLKYENSIVYHIGNLFLYLAAMLILCKALFQITKKYLLVITLWSLLILYPNNIHNICWIAARTDLMCFFFYCLSIYYSVRFFDGYENKYLILTSISFVCTILCKETGMTFPFILYLLAYIIKGKQFDYRIKILFSAQIFILCLYVIFRIAFLRNDLIQIGSLFQLYAFESTVNVFLRSIISSTIPIDFINLIFLLISNSPDLILIVYCLTLLVLSIYLLYNYIKREDGFSLIMILLSFIVLISPYLFIGYVRPQLILIPFSISLFVSFILFSRRLNLSSYFIKIPLSILVIIYLLWSYKTVNSWSIAYEKSEIILHQLDKIEFSKEKKSVILGLPARVGQFFMMEGILFSYNFSRYHKFVLIDTVIENISIGITSFELLQNDIYVNKTGENSFEISTTSQSQFLLITGSSIKNDNDVCENDYLTIEILELNSYNRISKLKITLKPQCDYYFYLKDSLIKLN